VIYASREYNRQRLEKLYLVTTDPETDWGTPLTNNHCVAERGVLVLDFGKIGHCWITRIID
jgi:hypothetical protein